MLYLGTLHPKKFYCGVIVLYKPLLTTNNAKTSKGEKYGYLTYVLYLTPSDFSGIVNVCPMSKIAGCGLDKTCLYHAGRGRMSTVVKGRLRKTQLFVHNKRAFFRDLIFDINLAKITAFHFNKKLAIRLNGTSDIQWEHISLEHEGKRYNNIFELFPDVQFYDYTKIPNRDLTIPNYDLTFSYSGTEAFKPFVEQALSRNMRMAVVFRNKKLPDYFMGKQVITGDDSDIRFIEPQNVIVGLYAKGQAIKDTSGFVVDC